jgi:hypothetical protein
VSQLLIKRAVDLRPGDIVMNVIAPGESKVKKLQYLKDNVRVRVIAANGASIVLGQFAEVEVKP